MHLVALRVAEEDERSSISSRLATKISSKLSVAFSYFPGNVMVGPISVRKPELLPPDFEEFVSDSGGHGFVMVSFGSYLESVLHKDKLEMLARAFGKVEAKSPMEAKSR